MVSEMNNYSDDEKLTLDNSTQTDVNTDLIVNKCRNCILQLSIIKKIRQLNLNNQVENLNEEEDDYVDIDQKCPICLGAWTDSGNHRLCALRCGHMFGYDCIKQWLNLNNKLSGRCPQCKTKAAIKHIRFLYTNKLSSKKYFKLSRIQEKLKDACYSQLKIKKALFKQKQKTKKYKKMYKASIVGVTANSNWKTRL